ncbi:MAG: hypothetical protein VX815_05150 [Gemmatimonadota bacterium]|nr:hypothetical protein [Gemmatimonadota bacterium]
MVSHAVPRRTRELGIRMSLGATARDVVRMAISGFLFGVQPNDVATFIAIPALLSSVALFAAWIPARRASRIDPVRALRRE